jgi:hypothetical protein
MTAFSPVVKFGYSLGLTRVMVDFLTEYRLQPGAVFERHGPITGPESDWARADQGTIDLLKLEVNADDSLPAEVKELAQNLLDSALVRPEGG